MGSRREAAQIGWQGISIHGAQIAFIPILPCFLTILVLDGFVGKSRAPRQLGMPFERE
jgi:ABC-type uncharacterized transport system permease subunit